MIFDAFLVGMTLGALFGVAPLVLGRFLGRKNFGTLGMLCSAFAGALLGAVVAILTAVVFSILVLMSKRDVETNPSFMQASTEPQIMCMSGPLQGRIYPIPADGLVLGRDQCCSLRLPGNAAGVSRRHCRIRLRDGKPILEDLQSSYGTYLATGQRLIANTPICLTNGSRFYLGHRSNQFQITM